MYQLSAVKLSDNPFRAVWPCMVSIRQLIDQRGTFHDCLRDPGGTMLGPESITVCRGCNAPRLPIPIAPTCRNPIPAKPKVFLPSRVACVVAHGWLLCRRRRVRALARLAARYDRVWLKSGVHITLSWQSACAPQSQGLSRVAVSWGWSEHGNGDRKMGRVPSTAMPVFVVREAPVSARLIRSVRTNP